MCKGGDCPMKDSCYRFRAIPYEFQSYISIPPVKDGYCEYFWELGENKRRIRSLEEIEIEGH